MACADRRAASGSGQQASTRKLSKRVRAITVSGLAVATAGLLAACGSSGAGPAASGNGGGSPDTAPGGNTVVTARQLSGVGTVLVDQAGKTVYSPEQEANGTIRCTGGCLSFWFPVTVSSAGIAAHPGGLSGVLSTIKRPDDGKLQVTYNGKPLYTFRLDASPGQAHGNNFTDSFAGASFTWQAVTTQGASSGSGPAGATPSSGSYPGSGSGY